MDFIVTQRQLAELVEFEKSVGKFTKMIGVKEELLEAAGIAEDAVRDIAEGTVALVHILNLSVAPLELVEKLKHFDSIS